MVKLVGRSFPGGIEDGAATVSRARRRDAIPLGDHLKRVFDVLVSAVALVLLAPLLLVLALVVFIAHGRPVLLRQRRPGLYGRPFILYKFRTMTNDRDAAGNLLPDEDRLTPVGRALRRTSLDELPELFNVLKGDMSLVGPRPLLMRYLERYTPDQMRRHNIRPGITGWTQVNGRNALSWEEKFALDLWYVEHRSLGLDAKILLLTLWKAVKCEGVTRPGWATTEEFWGLHGRPDDRPLAARLRDETY